jgi:hypothetical protein
LMWWHVACLMFSSLGACESTTGHMFVRASYSLMRKHVRQGINARDATLRYVLRAAANRSASRVRVGTVCRITRMQRHQLRGHPFVYVANGHATRSHGGWREQVCGIPIQRTHDTRACTRVLERRTMLAEEPTHKKLKLLCWAHNARSVRKDSTVHCMQCILHDEPQRDSHAWPAWPAGCMGSTCVVASDK